MRPPLARESHEPPKSFALSLPEEPGFLKSPPGLAAADRYVQPYPCHRVEERVQVRANLAIRRLPLLPREGILRRVEVAERCLEAVLLQASPDRVGCVALHRRCIL